MDLQKLRTKKFYGKAKTQFLAQKNDIKKALDEGYRLKTIWKFLVEEELFDAKYPQFLKYVADHLHSPISPKNKRRSDTLVLPPNKPPKPEPPANCPSKEEPYMLGGFLMDPKRPKRVHVDTPQSKPWNPIALTDEEIKHGITTDR